MSLLSGIESFIIVQQNIINNMVVLATGTAMAKLLTFATIPLITRLYSPLDFGILSIFISIVAILLPFCTFKYSTAIPLPKNDNIAINLLFMTVVISIIISILIFLIFFNFKDIIFHIFSIEQALSYWWIIPASLFLYSLYEVFSFWFTRTSQFKTLSKNLFYQTFLGVSVKIIFGVFSFGVLGLIIGQVLTQSAGVVGLFYRFIRNYRIKLQFKKMLFLSKYYGEFPKYKFPSHFLYILSFQSPLIFTSMIYGVEITGQLGLAFSVLALPITLFGNTTSQAYYSEISKIGRKQTKRIYYLTRDITKKLFIISIIPFTVLIIYAPVLFKVTFGIKWITAGEIAQILSIYLLFQFISSPIMQVFNVLKKQKEVFFIHLRRFIFVLIIFGLGKFFNFNIYQLMLIYSIVLGIHYIIIYFNVMKILKTG